MRTRDDLSQHCYGVATDHYWCVHAGAPYHAMPCHTIPYHAMSYHTMGIAAMDTTACGLRLALALFVL